MGPHVIKGGRSPIPQKRRLLTMAHLNLPLLWYRTWICLSLFFTDWDLMGFITIKTHHLGEYFWIFFHPHRRVANPSIV